MKYDKKEAETRVRGEHTRRWAGWEVREDDDEVLSLVLILCLSMKHSTCINKNKRNAKRNDLSVYNMII